MISRGHFTALLPHLVLLSGILATMLSISVVRRAHGVAFLATLVVLIASLFSVILAVDAGPRFITGLVRIDGYTHFFSALFLFAAIVTTVLAHPYMEHRTRYREEFYLLLSLATFGAMVMSAAIHFAAFVLGLEILSISLYAMIAYPQTKRSPIEAGIKYLILSGVASTTILFGIALNYAATGELMYISEWTPRNELSNAYFAVGQAFIWGGVAFKLSLVPFHMWTPDVYQGAPAPVAGYVATVAKGAVVSLALLYVLHSGAFNSPSMFLTISIMAVLSMIAGNVLALLQKNIKRLLAYSSIAHLGYLLIALLLTASSSASFPIESVMVYLTAYFLMTLAAFGIVSVFSANSDERELDLISDYTGLFWRDPFLAVMLMVVALSLAGIPMTLGFIGKFYLVAAGVEGSLWWLVWALVIGSGIGVYYYLRIIFTLIKPAELDVEGTSSSLNWMALTVVFFMGIALVLFGIYPAPLVDFIGQAVAFTRT